MVSKLITQTIDKHSVLSKDREYYYSCLLYDNRELVKSLLKRQSSGNKISPSGLTSLEKRLLAARNEMFLCNLRLVRRAVSNVLSIFSGCTEDDLMQEGGIVLLRCIDSYDPYLGFTFCTYCIKTLRYALLDKAAGLNKLIRTPKHIKPYYAKVEQLKKDFIKQYKKIPSFTDLAMVSDIPNDVLFFILYPPVVCSTQSLGPLETDEAYEIDSFLVDKKQLQENEDALELENLKLFLDGLFKQFLSDQEKLFICHKFGILGYEVISPRNLAPRLNLKETSGSVIFNRAMKKLRSPMAQYALSNFS